MNKTEQQKILHQYNVHWTKTEELKIQQLWSYQTRTKNILNESSVPGAEPAFLKLGGIPFSVCAVIIDDKVPQHPAIVQLLVAREVPRLVLIPPVISRGGHAGREGILPLASLDVEVPVGRHEWGVLPVRLLQPAPRCPVVRVPDAREQVHWLLVREEVVCVVCVFVYSYGDPVHIESVIWMENNKLDQIRRSKQLTCACQILQCISYTLHPKS